MKLAAIYNIFDGVELLRGSINCLKNDVDLFIIMYQETSNFGERFNPHIDEVFYNVVDACIGLENQVLFERFVPEELKGGLKNETRKRQKGIDLAITHKCTHFLSIDTDEYYKDFGLAKQMFIDSGAKGSVASIMTYFKEPTLRLENRDNYFVPFIHELRPDTTTGLRNPYPFYVDPTRRINETDVIELPVEMHHFSWVRKDIHRKARNSSAKANIEGSKLLQDWAVAHEGMYVTDYQQKLVRVDDYFGIGSF